MTPFLLRHKPNATFIPTGERVHVMDGPVSNERMAVIFADGKLRPIRKRELKDEK